MSEEGFDLDKLCPLLDKALKNAYRKINTVLGIPTPEEVVEMLDTIGKIEDYKEKFSSICKEL